MRSCCIYCFIACFIVIHLSEPKGLSQMWARNYSWKRHPRPSRLFLRPYWSSKIFLPHSKHCSSPLGSQNPRTQGKSQEKLSQDLSERTLNQKPRDRGSCPGAGAIGKLCTLSEPVSLSIKCGENAWLCFSPRISGASKRSHPRKMRVSAVLALHLSTRVQISSLSLPAWATLGKWFSLPGPQFPPLKMGLLLVPTSWSCCEEWSCEEHGAWYRTTTGSRCRGCYLGVNQIYSEWAWGLPSAPVRCPRCPQWHAAPSLEAAPVGIACNLLIPMAGSQMSRVS